MSYNFFELKDNSLIFTGDYMEVYIPKKLFKKDLNVVYGDIYHLMGIFNFKIGNEDKVINNDKLYTFNFPSMFDSKPSAFEEKEIKLIDEVGIDKYIVLKYLKNDKMMVSTEIVQNITNVQKFVNLLLAGAIPATIKYEDILRMFYKCLEINKETCNVPGIVLSMVVSELCRYSKNEAIQFRKVIGKNPGLSQLSYVMANYKNVCANTSTFNAITFEDIDTMLTYSINRERYNRPSIKSPNEELLEV